MRNAYHLSQRLPHVTPGRSPEGHGVHLVDRPSGIGLGGLATRGARDGDETATSPVVVPMSDPTCTLPTATNLQAAQSSCGGNDRTLDPTRFLTPPLRCVLHTHP